MGSRQLLARSSAAADLPTDAALPPASYDPAQRAVGNWRVEATSSLQPKPLAAAAVLLRVERPVIGRCVKLNNYWCIKRAGWKGEIGGDEEGHTGFASAAAGADAAVTLLRKYYVDYERRSALDIVRRWAPAECRIGLGGFSGLSAVLAVRGLANTLRARFLAARRGPASVGRQGARRRAVAPRPRVSRIASAPMPSFRVPDIASGMGERRPAARPGPVPRRPRVKLAAPASAKPAMRVAASARPVPSAPAFTGCGDEQRIQNYAARIAEAAGVAPAADLHLFDSEGRALPVLTRVLLAMSAVELGLLRANAPLVEGAIARFAPPPAAVVPSGPPLEALPDRPPAAPP